MTKYAKISENGILEYAPRNIAGASNWGLNAANVLAAGYLPVDSTVAPEGKRQAAYPSFGDQLDMIYWDQVNGTNLWQETITAVKVKYPKPED